MTWRLEIVPQRWPLVERGILSLLDRPCEVPLGRTVCIGRSPDCDVVVPSFAVNRRAAEILRNEDGVWLTDLNSRNGTFALTHASPSLVAIRTPTRLEVDDAFRVVEFTCVVVPRFVVPANWRSWDGGAIWRLAQAAQMGRDWSTLPVLADALEEAGGAEEELLKHFREVEHHLGHCAALLRLMEGLLGLRASK